MTTFDGLKPHMIGKIVSVTATLTQSETATRMVGRTRQEVPVPGTETTQTVVGVGRLSRYVTLNGASGVWFEGDHTGGTSVSYSAEATVEVEVFDA